MDLQIRVRKQVLTCRQTSVAGSVNFVKATFMFDSEWEGTEKHVMFSNGDIPVVELILGESNTCIVPWEALETEGSLYISVVGIAEGNIRITTKLMDNPITVYPSGEMGGTGPLPPTPSVWNDLKDYIDTKAVPSDWNISDSEDPAYVKNRPFYEEITTEEKEWKSYDWIIPETFENVEIDEAGNRSITIYIDYSLGLREGQPYLTFLTQLPSEEEFSFVDIAGYDKTMSVPILQSICGGFVLYDGVKRYSDTEYELGDFATLIISLNRDIDSDSIKDRKITFCKLPNKKVNLVSAGVGDAGSLALQEDWTYTVSLLKDDNVVASFTRTPRVVIDGSPYSESGRVLYLTAGSEGTSLDNDDLGFGFSDKIWSDMDCTHSSASYLWDGAVDADAISIVGHPKAIIITDRNIHKIPQRFLPDLPIANIKNYGLVKLGIGDNIDENGIPVGIDSFGKLRLPYYLAEIINSDSASNRQIPTVAAVYETIQKLPTIDAMDQAIQEKIQAEIQDRPTYMDMNDAILNATQDLPTTEMMNQAIQEALYVNTEEVIA